MPLCLVYQAKLRRRFSGMKTLLQKKFIISFAHLLFGLCFLAACGQDTSPPTTPTGGSTEPKQVTIQLTLSATALTVNITLNGLVANSTHMAHIHDGNCHKQGKIAFTLKPIVADASGIGHSTTEIPLTSLTSLSDKRPLYINVHFGATMQDLKTQPGYDSIACGDVVGLY